MKKIVLLSDTHSYIGKDCLAYLKQADEIWHAGDIGNPEVIDIIEGLGKIVRFVYGNIDTPEVRRRTNYDLSFQCEGVNVYMIHIGGYPTRYYRKVKEKLINLKPDLYICGHSHILKVMKDSNLDLIHFNPGAVGRYGINQFRTILVFECNNGKIENLRAIDFGERSNVPKSNAIIQNTDWSSTQNK